MSVTNRFTTNMTIFGIGYVLQKCLENSSFSKINGNYIINKKRGGNVKKKFFSFISISFMISIFVFFVLILYGLFQVHEVSKEITIIKYDIEQLKQEQSPTHTITQTEYLKTIEFMKNETEKFRSFIEDQQDFLVWLIGIIGTGFVALMTLLGIKSRKEISQTLKEEYDVKFKDEVASIIGEQKQVRFLDKCVKRERNAMETEILFIFQEENNDNLVKIYKFLEQQGYQVDKVNTGRMEKLCRKIKQYRMIIYQVGEEEYQKAEIDLAKEEIINSSKLAQICDENEIFCTLYCTQRLNGELNSLYVNKANFASTVLERIYSILYLIQER